MFSSRPFFKSFEANATSATLFIFSFIEYYSKK